MGFRQQLQRCRRRVADRVLSQNWVVVDQSSAGQHCYLVGTAGFAQ